MVLTPVRGTVRVDLTEPPSAFEGTAEEIVAAKEELLQAMR